MIATRKPGTCTIQADYTDPSRTTLRVLQADPYIHISTTLLDRISDQPDDYAGISIVDDVFTIRATNRTVIYRLLGLVEPMPGAPLVYEAEWPD